MSRLRKLSIEELNRKSIEEYKESVKMPVVLVLDNVRSLNNIGSIFRTCDALKAEKILLCGISAEPPHPEIHKTALGAEDSVRWEYYADTVQALIDLKKEGFKICAIEQTVQSIDLRIFKPEIGAKYAFVLGNELKGVHEHALDLSDFSIEIPQFGTKHSFNVAITAGIVLWDFFSKSKQ